MNKALLKYTMEKILKDANYKNVVVKKPGVMSTLHMKMNMLACGFYTSKKIKKHHYIVIQKRHWANSPRWSCKCFFFERYHKTNSWKKSYD